MLRELVDRLSESVADSLLTLVDADVNGPRALTQAEVEASRASLREVDAGRRVSTDELQSRLRAVR